MCIRDSTGTVVEGLREEMARDPILPTDGGAGAPEVRLAAATLEDLKRRQQLDLIIL